MRQEIRSRFLVLMVGLARLRRVKKGNTCAAVLLKTTRADAVLQDAMEQNLALVLRLEKSVCPQP